MPRYTRDQAAEAIAASHSWAEALRRLSMCASGGNWRTLKKYAGLWHLSADHFDPWRASQAHLGKPSKPLAEVLVANSSYKRGTLKARLYKEGLKEPRCELCGQGEMWRGEHMSLILDHINGVRDDNHLGNLRIVCPNCAATFDTHCGRATAGPPPLRSCLRCSVVFRAKYRRHYYCSRYCGLRSTNGRSGGRGGGRTPGVPQPATRKVTRPRFEHLVEEVERDGFLAVGRRYGVSDNAIRKWLLFFEREQARANDSSMPTLADIRRKYGRRKAA